MARRRSGTNDPALYLPGVNPTYLSPPTGAPISADDITTGTLGTGRFSAYDDLVAESKIGAGSTQVAAGDHTHEPFPVGGIFVATVSTNPATLLGYGTWTLLGSGYLTLV